MKSALILVSVIAVMVIQAAISIPADMDDAIRSRVSEVTTNFGALAIAATEYHVAMGQFPPRDFRIRDLVVISQRYGWFSCPARANKDDITYRFKFNNVISSSLDGCILDMKITYNPTEGYVKKWLSTSTLPERLRPRN
jgi:hypothetical protein